MLGVLEKYIEDVTQDVEALSVEDVQYSEAFEAVEAEIQKLQGVVPADPNWQLILDSGKTVLATQGKHLKIITYIIIALYKKYKIAGLLAGLYIFADLLSSQKDDIMPYGKRKKSRINLIMWMVKFIPDYRENNPLDLQLKDLDNIEQAKLEVIAWFDEFHPSDDSLALTHLYDWFLNAKSLLENEDKLREQEQIEAQQAINSYSTLETKSEVNVDQNDDGELVFGPELDLNVDDPIEKQKRVLARKAIVRAKEEQEQKRLEKQQVVDQNFSEQEDNTLQKQSLDIKDISSTRQYIVSEMLDRLASSKENQEELFLLMMQSRKALWNTIYYKSIAEEISKTKVSSDFINFNEILCIADPLARIAELERLFIKNPFSLDIQMYILKALDDVMFTSDTSGVTNIKNYILHELNILLTYNNIFDWSYSDKKCIPEYIYDWAFTQLVDDISAVRSKFDEYIINMDAEKQYFKILKYARESRSFNLKMSYLLMLFNNSYLDNEAKIALYEKFLNEDSVSKEIMISNPEVKVAYENLKGFYGTAILAEKADKQMVLRKKDIAKKILL